MTKIIFVPGNGNSTTQDNWFPSIKQIFESNNLEVIASKFPDPDLARQEYWLPFLTNELKADESTILIGHSSGAVAAMRLAEKIKLLGLVLVGAYYTDLNIEKEKLSGYFNKPWQWHKIKENIQWSMLFASTDDPWIPIEQPRRIHNQLLCDYYEYDNYGHFGGDYYKQYFPELASAVLKKLNMNDNCFNDEKNYEAAFGILKNEKIDSLLYQKEMRKEWK